MAFTTIAKLRETLKIGARANLFEIDINFPTDVGAGTTALADSQVLCKAAAVPGFTIGTIEVPFRAGRRIKIPGDRTFADWTVTIINDENHTLRRAFNSWINLISKGDYQSTTKSSSQAYFCTIMCKHLKADGTISRRYELNDAFPTDVSAIDLSFDSTDTLSEFTVNFQYSHLKAGPSGTGAFGSIADLELSI